MRRHAFVLIAVAALTLAACTEATPGASTTVGNEASITDISIGTSVGLAPTLTLPEGRVFTQSQGKVVWEGAGEPLVDDQPLLVDIYGVSLADGSVIMNTFDGLPRPLVLAREVVGDELYSLLINSNVGSRLLVVATSGEVEPEGSEEASKAPEPDVAMVIDVLSHRAVGTPLPQSADLPRVTVNEDTGEPTITMPDRDEPTAVQQAVLIQGDGQQLKEGSYFLVNYKAVRWKDGSEFASSWSNDTAPFATQLTAGQVIPAWSQALLDQTVGSQVLIVAPPTAGYPDEGTLVFVVDILDVWNPVD